jgi:hypothetical protein
MSGHRIHNPGQGSQLNGAAIFRTRKPQASIILHPLSAVFPAGYPWRRLSDLSRTTAPCRESLTRCRKVSGFVSVVNAVESGKDMQ